MNYKKRIWQSSINFSISLVVALAIWLGFTYSSVNVQRNFVASLEFQNLSENYQIKEYQPQEVILTLSGKNTDFSSFDTQNLKVSISLENNLRVGWHKILIENKDISLSNSFSVVKIDPESIQVQLEEKKTH